ncbi:MAG TPA: transposase domain-containing protein [Polyangiaceae bacterium]|nr:transposase domain-containing protein [Polyangiaceae bacterium]
MSNHTARELVAMQLPGLPRSRRRLEMVLRTLPSTERERQDGRGAERVYHISALPIEAQAALARTASKIASAPLLADVADAAPQHRVTAVERIQLVHAAQALIAGGTPKVVAYESVAQGTEYSARSVRRFCKAVRGVPEAQWPEVLLPQYTSNTQQAECHPDAWAYIKSDYLSPSQPAFAACYRRMAKVARDQNWQPIPSAKTLLNRIEREVPSTVITLMRQGPDALERLYPAQERDHSTVGVMGAWNADGHRADVMVRWPDGEEARPIVLAFQDVASGKIVSYRVDRTENGDQVRLAFADAIERYGVPDAVYLDNGRGFANKWFTGGTKWRFRFKVREEDPTGLLMQLGVAVHWTTPYHGQSKPIERAWRDLVENVARHPAFEGAYLGSDTTSKPHNYGQRVVELSEFIRVLDAQVREHNAREGRRSKACQGRSFDQVFDAGYATATVRRVTDAQRRLLLLAADGVTVRRDTASIYLLDNRYWAEPLCELQGDKVVVRFDPANVKAGLHVYKLDGTYVCYAEAQETYGFNDTTAARDYARKRKAFVRVAKQKASLERTLEAGELARMHLQAQGAPEPERTTKVVRGSFGVSRKKVAEVAAPPPAADDSFLREVEAISRAQLRRGVG